MIFCSDVGDSLYFVLKKKYIYAFVGAVLKKKKMNRSVLPMRSSRVCDHDGDGIHPLHWF